MDEKQLVSFFQQLDRAVFLDDDMRDLAGLNQPLPIGFGQTISQPTLVVEMTAQLAPDMGSRVLEIGTGSGYQTAFLAEFSAEVYTVERISELSGKAESRLATLGYRNIHYRVGDGSAGWPENAPYDRIMVTAAASAVPDELLDQLDRGGRMVIPVGQRGLQDLLLITRDQAGLIHRETIEKVIFVELVGRYGWS